MNTPPTDPYTPPKAAPPSEAAEQFTIFRHDDSLYVTTNTELPELCLVTHSPTGVNDWRKQANLVYYPAWVWLGLLGGLIPLIILLLVGQKKARITYSLSRETRSTIVKKQIASGIFATLGVALMFGGFAFMDGGDTAGLLIISGLLLLFISLIGAALAKPIKVTGYKNGWFRLKGVSRDFLDTLPTRTP